MLTILHIIIYLFSLLTSISTILLFKNQVYHGLRNVGCHDAVVTVYKLKSGYAQFNGGLQIVARQKSISAELVVLTADTLT